MSAILDPTEQFNWPTLNIEGPKLVALTQSCMAAGVTYGLGAKVSPLSLQAGEFDAVDCSGFFRWLIWHATTATGEAWAPPDGSQTQWAYIQNKGFKPSDLSGAHQDDGIIRAGFLPTAATPDHIGHVLMMLNGYSMESHGNGHGPDRRAVDDLPYLHSFRWFVLGGVAK